MLRLIGEAPRVLDGTLGGGGHTAAFLERGATVVGVDRDPAARDQAAQRLAAFIESGKLTIVPASFADAAGDTLPAEPKFGGILLDLGVSSHQIDDEARGFTFREGAALDMRMAEVRGERQEARGTGTAAELLNGASEAELATIFREYGDEPKARRLARAVVYRRERQAFATSDDLVGAIRSALGPRTGPGDFARLFQAVRIAVNDEIGELQRALPLLRDRLTPGGVLVVISYHSGEDRVVKRAFQDWSRACTCPPRQPMCTCGGVAMGTTITRKAVQASEAEVARNARARSARLRAWRRADG